MDNIVSKYKSYRYVTYGKDAVRDIYVGNSSVLGSVVPQI